MKTFDQPMPYCQAIIGESACRCLNRFARSFYITVRHAYVQDQSAETWPSFCYQITQCRHGVTDSDLAAGCRHTEGTLPSSSRQSRMFQLLFRQTGRTDHSSSTASLRYPGDLAKCSQQVLRQCMSLNRTTYSGKVSSHCPVSIGSISVVPRMTTSLEGFTGRFVRHLEAESATGWQHPVNTIFACQA